MYTSWNKLLKRNLQQAENVEAHSIFKTTDT